MDANCDGASDYDQDGDGHDWDEFGGDDCYDLDPFVVLTCETCADSDGDGVLAGCDNLPPGTPEDCDDNDPQNWTPTGCANCRDEDDDGFFVDCDDYAQGDPDCDDSIANAWYSCVACLDTDGDGLGSGGCDLPLEDCDDARVNAWYTCTTCPDLDLDGVGAGACDALPTDVDDTDPNRFSPQSLCVDGDGDGYFVDCDAYAAAERDCDDGDPSVGAVEWEVPGDGIDQDCDRTDLLIDEAHGVFVRPSGVDSASCGTRAAPCGTLQHAVDKAATHGKVVFAAAGEYETHLVQRAPLWGSFDASSWAYAPGPEPTTIVRGSVRLDRQARAPELVLGSVSVVAGSSASPRRRLVSAEHPRSVLDSVLATLDDSAAESIAIRGPSSISDHRK